MLLKKVVPPRRASRREAEETKVEETGPMTSFHAESRPIHPVLGKAELVLRMTTALLMTAAASLVLVGIAACCGAFPDPDLFVLLP
jgi:hypothetical protein